MNNLARANVLRRIASYGPRIEKDLKQGNITDVNSMYMLILSKIGEEPNDNKPLDAGFYDLERKLVELSTKRMPEW